MISLHDKAKSDEMGVSSTVFSIVTGFIFLFIVIAAGYIVISDRLNGNDAYRVKEVRDQRDALKADCEDKTKTLQRMQEWVRQENLRPPIDIMTIKPCRLISPIEKDL